MSSFDEILKKGKQAAVGNNNPKNAWKVCITNIMYELHRLNKMYGKDLEHHLLVEQRKCEKCGLASFIVAVRDFDNRKRVIKFHKGDWKAIDKDKYHCDKCK